VRSRRRALALPALLAVVSCGGAPTVPAAAKPTPGAKAPAASKLVEMVTPSRLLPDLTGERGVVARDGGQRRVLLDRMRMIARDDGAIERATDLLPRGNVTAVALPSRLGGGYLFHANSGSGAQIWRATDWLAKLRPLVQLSAVVEAIVPGFDRLYVRYQSNGRLAAIDAETGEPRGLGTLPAAAAYGRLAFADGWRAVVDTDLRGPLATFDAGATWRSVGIAERPLSIDVVSGDPAVTVAGGRYLVDARGAVTFRPEVPREVGAPMDDLEIAARQPGLLGKKPLRAALEDGFPDTLTTAIVARAGALVRVSLHDGAVLATAEDAYPDRLASCHALRVGAGSGFLCGERDGATSVYEFVPPFALRPALHFAKPRFVAASGNGALVVRGACEDQGGGADAAVEDGARPYCIRSAAGELHEIRIKGEIGVERVIALESGRVVVLVPPRGGSPGQLTVLGGSSATTIPLALPADPPFVDRLLRRGMWLDGFEEREKGVLGGWVEAGGPVIGVRIKLDGTVTAGDARDDAGGAIVAGRFGLSLGEGGRAAETVDGGLHWEVLDLPERDDEADRAGPTRACGPLGCVIGGWLRVGWGKAESEDDMRAAAPPPSSYTPTRSAPQIGFSCELGAVATPPLPVVLKSTAARVVGKAAAIVGPKPPGPAGVIGTMAGRYAVGPGVVAPVTPNGWPSFRNTPAPPLVDGEIGIDNGPYADTIMVHAYAWGKRGADWSRAGRWLVRFDDRFDAAGGVRSSAASSSPWADEIQAAEAIGAGGYGAAAWAAYLDPSGKAAFTHACRGSTCSFFAVTDGQPVLPVRDAQGRTGTMLRPYPNGAVRVGETWYVVTQGSTYEAVILWRIDLGVARQLGTYYRPARYGLESPRIVRRAFGGAVGLLVVGPPEPGDRVGSWYVLPVNTESGEIGEAVQLVRRDLAGITLERCAAGRDGWVVDTAFDSSASIDVNGSYGAFDAVEMRSRMDSGSLCIEALASRVDGLSSKPKTPGGKVEVPRPSPSAATTSADAASISIPLAATERGTGRRWALSCKPRRLFGQKP
jgi:hypothetical protein